MTTLCLLTLLILSQSIKITTIVITHSTPLSKSLGKIRINSTKDTSTITGETRNGYLPE